ncbi:MAG: hypothetical protein JWQ40_2106 [Segetibacter sp.]|jgi:hypothetical protein|nr:hypothetical protein [Segetibacter sp.]
MKKLILAALLFHAASCSNPEDKATGDADSTSFNSSDASFNSPPGGASDSQGSMAPGLDTSAAPAIDKKNADSKTDGTNRSYGADSGKKKSH